MCWHICVCDNDYEICDEFPYSIRRIGKTRIIHETPTRYGYIQVHLNNHAVFKHDVLANQFLINDDPINKTVVNHKNKHRDDNRLDNLEWSTSSENNENILSHNGVNYEFVDKLPEDSFMIDKYSGHDLKRDSYFYSKSADKFYFRNSSNYRVMHELAGGNINVRDINNHRRCIHVSCFKKQHRIM